MLKTGVLRKDMWVVLCATLTVLSLWASSCTSKPLSVNQTHMALGTYVKIVIITDRENRERALNTIEHAYDLIDTWERSYTYRSNDGDLARFNTGTTLLRKDNEKLYELLVQSLEYAHITGGFFDPTVLPLIKLWGFDTDSPSVPAHEDILTALERVGYTHVFVSEDRIEKPEGIQFDLSGIAKGKIVDMTRDYLREAGFSDFLVDAGGDIYVHGMSLDRSKWRIAIQDPVHRGQYSGILEKSDTAIVTSGDYENFFEQGGKRYSHLFNPFTGYPNSDINSVTIIAEETAFADAVATAVFTMGSEEGYRFLRENIIEGMIIFHAQVDTVDTKDTPHFWD